MSLFAGDVIVYIENLTDSTKEILDLISEFGKTAGYKVNTEKSKAFLYNNNEKSEKEIRKNIPLDIATRKILRNKTIQQGKKPVLRKLHNTEERN